MATQQTLKFGDIAFQLETAPGSGIFETVCGFTSVDHQFNVSTQTEDLPDCDDPDAVAFEAPQKTSVGESISFQGFVDDANSDLLRTWVYATEPQQIRLVFNGNTKKGYLDGPAEFTGGGESWERRQSGRLTGGFAFVEKPTWTATP